MVQIPTTERKYYNTTTKVNTLSAYAGALLPAAQDLQNTIKEQQEIKISSLGLEARIKMSDATNQWRLDNQSNPNDPTALKDLQNTYNSILSEYRGQIDPLYRSSWDIQGNKLKASFDLNNQEWGFKQRQINAENDIKRDMENYYKLAYGYGQTGSLEQAAIDYQQSYDKLLDYGAKNLGTETAAQLLNTYERDYATQFLSGMAKSNPQQALNLLQDENFARMLGKDTGEMAHKIIKNEIERQDFELKMGQYNNQLNLTNQFDDMNPIDALQTLEENRANVSEKWYNTRKRSLLNQMGITAETQAETANSILFDIASIPSDNPKGFIQGSTKVLEKIENEYASGKLSLSDKKMFVKDLTKRQANALPDYIKSESSWFSPYDFSDAKDDFDNSFSDAGMSNRAMLEYARTISDKDYDTKQKKDLVRTIISNYKNKELNKAITGLKIGDEIAGYKYLGGDKNDPNSWKEVK